MNTLATGATGALLRSTTAADFDPPAPMERTGLQYLRASGLAQARLQLAVLSGNRRGALREIDRLVEIDRQLGRIAELAEPDSEAIPADCMDAHLASQQRAIASEKLALVAAVEFPRLPAQPDHGELLLDGENEWPVVEDTAFGRKLALAGFWLLALILLGTALAIAIPALAAG